MIRNKRALITGCTSGIGHEIARGLAKQGFDLILLGRSETKLQKLDIELTNLSRKKIDVEYFICDFEDLDQVASVSKLISNAYREIDVLINNAGIWDLKYKKTENGWENTWVVNYFASFILTNNLLLNLRLTAEETHNVRIINMTSEAHRYGKITFPLAQYFHFFRTYGSTKLANVLHAFYLASSLEQEGIYVNAVHPGVVATDLWKGLPKFIADASKKWMVTVEEGAKTPLSLVLSEDLMVTGRYFKNMKSSVPSKTAQNRELMVQLYETTHELLNKYLTA
ncbi:SDR family NAD(P)-dependent oxidoreductase [bacterium]|nr:SDR family NAD(P)-dependent oxidoreductase [bacterium]